MTPPRAGALRATRRLLGGGNNHNFGLPCGATPAKRAGGGGRKYYRAITQELSWHGGIPAKLGWMVGRCVPTALHRDYLSRSDLMHDIRNPQMNNVAQSMQLGDAMHAGGYFRNLKWGVRWAHVSTDLGHRQNNMVRRLQLIKYCKHCYYWTDGSYHYNFCTQNPQAHWHKKTFDQQPREGYRLYSRVGGRCPQRKLMFQPPIHRLGTMFPIKGNSKMAGRQGWHFYGNPAYGSFDKYLVMRRFMYVGRKDFHRRYDVIQHFHREI